VLGDLEVMRRKAKSPLQHPRQQALVRRPGPRVLLGQEGLIDAHHQRREDGGITGTAAGLLEEDLDLGDQRVIRAERRTPRRHGPRRKREHAALHVPALRLRHAREDRPQASSDLLVRQDRQRLVDGGAQILRNRRARRASHIPDVDDRAARRKHERRPSLGVTVAGRGVHGRCVL